MVLGFRVRIGRGGRRARARARAAGGPRGLRVLLEGESLLNDASSITLFTIFLKKVEEYSNNIDTQSGWAVLGDVCRQTVWLAVGAHARMPARLRVVTCVRSYSCQAHANEAGARARAPQTSAQASAAPGGRSQPGLCARRAPGWAGLRGAARARGPHQLLTRRAAPAAGGFLIGIAFGIGTRYVLRWMRHLGAGIEQQVALTFALGYLSFYTANGPAAVSGAPRAPCPARPGAPVRPSAAWPCSAAACASGWAVSRGAASVQPLGLALFMPRAWRARAHQSGCDSRRMLPESVCGCVTCVMCWCATRVARCPALGTLRRARHALQACMCAPRLPQP